LRDRFGDRLNLVISTLLRTAAGLAVFMVLARTLGPVQYGLFTTVFAYAVIAAFIADFGYATKALRDIAAEPARGGAILAHALTVKIILSATICLVGSAIILFLPNPIGVKLACMAIAAGVFAASIGDLAMVAFRAIGQYGREARLVGWTSIVYAVILIGAAMLHSNVLSVGLGFLAARAIYMVFAIRGAFAQLPPSDRKSLHMGETLASLRGSVAWAADSGLGFLSSQVDAILVANLLGLGAAGVYQSGARFVQTALSFASVLSNIHIPRLASRSGHLDLRAEWRMAAEFVGLGAVFGVGLLLVGPLLTRFVLGEQYARVDHLWPGFAAFLVARYAAAAFGAALSAVARPGLRIVAQALGLGLILAGFAWAVTRFGLVAAPWVMTAGALITTLAYAVGAWSPSNTNRKGSDGSPA
jgi:O-antigen/teichoic acid export membrane protein